MSPSAPATLAARRLRGALKSPQDFAAGVFLLILAMVALVGTRDLEFGRFSSIGPGFMPRGIAILIAAFGLLFVVQSLIWEGSRLDRWSLRGPFFVLGAALAFAWAIRPLGLIIAGPLAVAIAAAADRGARPVEVLIFAIMLTAACIGLFSVLLQLPIPVLPSALPFPLSLWL